MSEYLRPQDSSSLELSRCSYDRARLTIPQDLSEDAFLRLAKSIAHMRGSVHWWVGDALVYADQKFGELAAQYEDIFGLTYQQLADYKWVASRIDPEIRERPDVLPWSHHRDIAKLEGKEKQHEWIQIAATERLTRAELRTRMEEAGVFPKKAKTVASEKGDEKPAGPPTVEAALADLNVEQLTDTICAQLDQLADLETNEADMALYQIQATVDGLITKREQASKTIEVASND